MPDNRNICAYCGMVYGEDWCPDECDCQKPNSSFKELKRCQVCRKLEDECDNWNPYYQCCEECLNA